MSTKSLLKSSMLKLGSSGAMPTNDTITYNANFIAPCDGYAYLRARANAAGAWQSLGTGPLGSVVNSSAAEHVPEVFAPCRKGQSITYALGSSSLIELKFIKSLGGGYKSLLKLILGGAVCLKTISENLLKRAQDFLSLPHWEMELASTVHKTQSLLSSLHQMDGSSLMRKGLMSTLLSINTPIEAQKVCQKPFIWVALTTPVLKVSQSITSSLGTLSYTLWLSSTHVNQLSKVNGGAL